jgi:MoxR-like ATPase
MNTMTHDGVKLQLADPVDLDLQWVGRQELVFQVLAAWMVVADGDLPLAPRLVGKPGVGKTTLAYAAARAVERPVYLFQATMDTRPEDLVIRPVVAGPQQLKYVASPVVAAMLTGGVLILDEGNRMSEKAWASLAPLLDRRRYVESVVASIRIPAHPDFRFCTTMNDDASTYDLPEYIHSRLQPQIYVDFPEAQEEKTILQANLPFADAGLLDYVVQFLQAAHEADEPYTVRDGINVARYALKVHRFDESTGRKRQDSCGPQSAAGLPSADLIGLFRRSVLMILGQSALRYVPRREFKKNR